MIAQHARLARSLAQELGLEAPVLDALGASYERWDGKGYPAGLAGLEIPLCSRIVALADVYDALTSKRVYKSALAHDVAKGIIVGDAGAHFDPAVVGAFLAAEAGFIAIAERYREPWLRVRLAEIYESGDADNDSARPR